MAGTDVVNKSEGMPKAEDKPVRKLPDPPEPTKEDRQKTLLDGYAFGLEHNSPRTPAELAELRYLFGLDDKPVPLTPEEKKALLAGPRVRRDTFLMEPGDRVPVNTVMAPVPAAVAAAHPDLAGLVYVAVGDAVVTDGDQLVLADPVNRGIVAVV